MNKRHYEHTLPNIRGSLSNTYLYGDNSRQGALPAKGGKGSRFLHWPLPDEAFLRGGSGTTVDANGMATRVRDLFRSLRDVGGPPHMRTPAGRPELAMYLSGHVLETVIPPFPGTGRGGGYRASPLLLHRLQRLVLRHLRAHP